MANEYEKGKSKKDQISILGVIIRFIVAAIVLLLTSYLVPGFDEISFGTALVAAIVIAILDYAINKLFNFDASPFGRGIVGFLISALIIYLTQFIVVGMQITVIGAIIAAFIIGILDMIIPIDIM